MSETGWLVIGANGQLGRALQIVLASHDDVIFWTRDEADLTNPLALKNALSEIQPTVIINASAYTAVDKAEEDEATANAVNGDSVGVMADFCAARGIPLVHVSTDYVYDGKGDQPFTEETPTSPLGAYGRSKLAGEEAVRASGCDYLIFRTSWVYDRTGKNFLTTMLRLGRERQELKVVADQIGAPTFAGDLAEGIVNCLNKALEMDAFPSGVYHMAGSGETSWHGFAEAIFEAARAAGEELAVKQVYAIPSSEFPTPTERPKNSRLSMKKLEQTFDFTMPDWYDALRQALANKLGG